MRLSKRGKRRILIVCSIVVGLVLVGTILVLNRGAAQDHRIAEARVDGLAAHAEGDYETALRKLSVYLSSNRSDVEALVAFADARSKIPVENNRHVLEAISLYLAALAIEPENLDGLSGLLLMYERTGRQVEMREMAQRILALDSDNVDALRLRALSSFMQSDYEQALNDSSRLIEIEPEKIEWRALQLQVLRSQNVPLDDLLQVCDQWDAEFAGDGRYLLMKAQLLALAGQQSAAEDAARDAAERGAHSVDVLRQMVNMLDAMQLRQDAEDLIARTQEAFSEEYWPYEAQVQRDWQGNRLSSALAVIDQVKGQQGELSHDLMQWQALLLLMLDRNDEAREVVAQLSAQISDVSDEQRDARLGWLQAIRARLTAGTVPWRETRDAYQMAVSLAPRDAVLHFLLGEAYMGIGEYDLATRSLEHAKQSDPHWLGAHVAHVEAMLLAGQVGQALEAAHNLIARVETPGLTAYTLFARAWLEAGRPNEGIGLVDRQTGSSVTMLQLLERLYDFYSDDPALATLLARAGATYDKPDRATHVIQQALENPEAPESLLTSLALLSQRHHLGQTEQLLEHAQEIHGMTLGIAETTAQIKHQQGRSQEGLAILRETISQLERNDAETRRVLASYLATIRDPDAYRELRKVLDDGPTAAGFVLGFDWTWEDAELTRQAIERLSDAVGEDSPRVAVARAHYVLRHEAGSDAALADAQVTLNEVLQRVPDSLSALTLMAHLALQGDRPNVDQAIRHLEQAIRYYPHHADLYLRVIPLLQSRGDFVAADDYLNRVRTLAVNDPRVRQAELDLWRTQGNFEQVISRLSETIDSSSSEADQLMYAANLHRAGRQREADEILRQLLQRSDHTEMTVLIAAQFYADLGRFDDALRVIDQSAAIDDELSRAVLLGRVYQHANRPAEARTYLERAVELDPDNIEAMTFLMGVLLSLADNRAAYDLARTALELDPDNESIRSTLALAAMQLGGREQQAAMAIMGEIEDEQSAMSRTLQLFSRVSRPDGLSVTRQDLLDLRELTLDFPQYMPGWRLAIIAHAEAGETNEAIRLARQAAARLPHLPDPAQMGTQLLVQVGRLNEALEMAHMWRQRSLNRPIEADVTIAAIRIDLDRFAEALQQLDPHVDRLFAERAEHPRRVSLWLLAALQSGLHAEAARRFEGIFDDAGQWQHTWLETAGLLKEKVNAQRTIEFAAAHGTDEPQWLLALASAWSQFANRFDAPAAFGEAEDLAQRIGQDDDLYTASLIIRAQNADWSGDASLAESHYRSALSLDPENPIVLNNLASILHRTERDCTEAEAMAAKAAQLAPEIPEIRNTHALAKLCLDDPGAAEQLARAALELRPQSPDFLVTLGLAQARQEHWEEAAATLAQIDGLVTDQADTASRTLRERVSQLREMLSQAGSQGVASDQATARVP